MERSISTSELAAENGVAVVNAYGSVIEDNEDHVDDSTMEDRTYCDCKGQCARKKGRGSCKCREVNLKCHDLCACDKGKCKNKPNDRAAESEELQPQPFAVADGDSRFEQELQDAQNEIKEFVATLDLPTKDKLLVNLLSMGRGSLDFAKSLITVNSAPEPPFHDIPAPEWCKCRVCRPMPSDEENLCCKRVTCVTSYTSFSNICLDRDILEVCIKARCDIRADDFNFSMESFRKAGYRQFALWRYGKLGRGNRRVLPACVVKRIRAQYPAPDGRYMGYRAN